MKTDDLIRARAADNAVRPMPSRRAFAVAMIPGVVIAFSLYLAIFGPRPNFLGLLTEPRLLFYLLRFPPIWSCVLASRVLKSVAPLSCLRSFRSSWRLAISPNSSVFQ